jgi:hypothetical protein
MSDKRCCNCALVNSVEGFAKCEECHTHLDHPAFQTNEHLQLLDVKRQYDAMLQRLTDLIIDLDKYPSDSVNKAYMARTLRVLKEEAGR